MCLILFAWDCHPRYRLVLAANRDEFHVRPTAAADWWAAPEMLAGRDLVGGGTWLGVDRTGRWAAVTNYRDFRDPDHRRTDARSRGLLVPAFLAAAASPEEWLGDVAAAAPAYRAFNLLAGAGDQLAWFGSRAGGVHRIAPGIHGLSNALVDTPWPKVAAGKTVLANLLENDRLNLDALFALLADRTPALPGQLPDTGVGPEMERLLSARFIQSAAYGTRCSTLLLIGRNGAVAFEERRFDAEGTCQGVVREGFATTF